MIDFNSTAMKKRADVKDIHEVVNAAIQSKNRSQKRRSYVGASSIGSGCERKVQYGFMGEPVDEGWQFSAKTLRIFERGHKVEEWAADWLRDAGFTIQTVKEDGGQLGFVAADGQFKGHIDGLIKAAPIPLKLPLLWEHKAIGDKSFKAIVKNGVAKAKPEYADQIATYQAYLDITNPALFQATNMDTMEVHYELISFDAKRAQAASDRAVSIIQDTRAGALRPKPTSDPDFWLCRNCEYKRRCWG